MDEVYGGGVDGEHFGNHDYDVGTDVATTISMLTLRTMSTLMLRSVPMTIPMMILTVMIVIFLHYLLNT